MAEKNWTQIGSIRIEGEDSRVLRAFERGSYEFQRVPEGGKPLALYREQRSEGTTWYDHKGCEFPYPIAFQLTGLDDEAGHEELDRYQMPDEMLRPVRKARTKSRAKTEDSESGIIKPPFYEVHIFTDDTGLIAESKWIKDPAETYETIMRIKKARGTEIKRIHISYVNEKFYDHDISLKELEKIAAGQAGKSPSGEDAR